MECPRQWEQLRQSDEKLECDLEAWKIGAFCIVKNAIPNLVLARNTHCSSS